MAKVGARRPRVTVGMMRKGAVKAGLPRNARLVNKGKRGAKSAKKSRSSGT